MVEPVALVKNCLSFKVTLDSLRNLVDKYLITSHVRDLVGIKSLLH